MHGKLHNSPLNALKGEYPSTSCYPQTQSNNPVLSTSSSPLQVLQSPSSNMKFFVRSAVLAVCVVSSLVCYKIALSYHRPMSKLLGRVQRWLPVVLSISSARVMFVAPAQTLNTASITRPVHLTAAMDPGMYQYYNWSISRPMLLTLFTSNIFGCNCDGGCRKKSRSENPSLQLKTSSSYVEVLSVLYHLRTLMHKVLVSRNDNESRCVTAAFRFAIWARKAL